VQRRLSPATVSEICGHLGPVQEEIEREVIEALLARRFRDLTRAKDEFYETSRFEPTCPEIARPRPEEEIRRVLAFLEGRKQ